MMEKRCGAPRSKLLVAGILIVSNVATFLYTSNCGPISNELQKKNRLMYEDINKEKLTMSFPVHHETFEVQTEKVTDHETCECPTQQEKSCTSSYDPNMKTVFVITPTYHRLTQKIDLNSMCHTLMSVPKAVWIIIEDSSKPTDLVTRLIQRCKVEIVHLVVPTSSIYKQKGKPWQNLPRGVEQRNAGLNWLREHYSSDDCNGAFYFADDDNKYDLRLFEDIRNTRSASVWRVAWAGGLKWEGPTCNNGRVASWHSFYSHRLIPVDMAAFAVDLCELFKHPLAKIGVDVNGNPSKNGQLETNFLEHFGNKSTFDCRGAENETYVWHSKTASPNLQMEKALPSNKAVETD